MIGYDRHTEVTASGKFIYVIKPYYRDERTRQITNEQNIGFSGVRLEVPFYGGVGRTTSRRKAQRFSEEFEYKVYLHKDDNPWPEAKVGPREDIEEYATEESTYSVDETDDEDD